MIEWTEAGIWLKAWTRLLRELHEFNEIHQDEAMSDDTLAPAKKGEAVGNTKKG